MLPIIANITNATELPNPYSGNPNPNYHAQMLMGMVAAYKVGGLYLVDDENSLSGNVFTTGSGFYSAVTAGVTSLSDPSNVLVDFNSYLASNVSSSSKIIFGCDFGIGNEQFVYKYNLRQTNSSIHYATGWTLQATNDPLGSAATDDKWFDIDYREDYPSTGLTIAENSNYYTVYTPAAYRTYRIVFTGFASAFNLFSIDKIEFFSGAASADLASQFITCATTAMYLGQDKSVDSPFSGTWYRTYDSDSVPNSSPPAAYHDTNSVYHMQNWASLVNAYTVIDDTTLKSQLRYGIRLGLDHMTKYRIQSDGTLTKWYLTTGGTEIDPADQSYNNPSLEYTRGLGLLAQIMLDEPAFWTTTEFETVVNTLNRSAQALAPTSKYFFGQAAEYNMFNSVITSTTVNSDLYFDLR